MKQLTKKILITTLMSLIMAIVFMPLSFHFAPQQGLCGVASETGNSNFTNLVVFVKFAGETEFINDEYEGATVKQITENGYSLADYSVKDYYSCVSGGKVNIQTVYLFNSDGSSLTLSQSRGYYCTYDATTNPAGYTSNQKQWRTSELRQDWADAINDCVADGGIITSADGSKTYSVSDLDKNGDGVIDCITIMYKYSSSYSVAYNDCLWSYQSYSDRVELAVDGGTITSERYLQMTANYNYLYSDASGRKIPSLKTMVHEMGHIFGLYDLYKTEENSPVYYMSAMANAITPAPQYISAKEREALGWLEADNVSNLTSQGDYTINVTKSEAPTGVVCYKYALPNTNKILYLEYRKFDGTENKYDSQSKTIKNSSGVIVSGISGLKSGLVCFLVNNDVQFPSNLYAQNNNWQYEVLGGQATKVDSALDVSDELFVTSNLKISVKSRTNNSLTFSVSGSDIPSVHTHNLTKITGNNATCTTAGNIEYWHCDECNKYFSNAEATTEITQGATVLSPLNHNLTHIEYLAPTCTTAGNIEYWRCERCNKYFSNAEATIEITQTVAVIPQTKHSPSDWIIDKIPTPTELGSKHKECTECGTELERETITYTAPPTPPAGEDNPPTSNGDVNNNKNNAQDNFKLQKFSDVEQTTLIFVMAIFGAIIAFACILLIILKHRHHK